MMKFIVELKRDYDPKGQAALRIETWRYFARDLAMCRVTQLLIVHPHADLSESSKTDDDGFITFRFTLRVDHS